MKMQQNRLLCCLIIKTGTFVATVVVVLPSWGDRGSTLDLHPHYNFLTKQQQLSSSSSSSSSSSFVIPHQQQQEPT